MQFVWYTQAITTDPWSYFSEKFSWMELTPALTWPDVFVVLKDELPLPRAIPKCVWESIFQQINGFFHWCNFTLGGWPDWRLCLLQSSFDCEWCVFVCKYMWSTWNAFIVCCIGWQWRFLTQYDHYFRRRKRISITIRSLKAFIFQWTTRKNLWFLFRYEFTLVSRRSLVYIDSLCLSSISGFGPNPFSKAAIA